MPRAPCVQAVETIYHLTTQSACGTPLFRDDDDRGCSARSPTPSAGGTAGSATPGAWSSHAEALGLRTPQPFCDPYDVLAIFDGRSAYKRYVDAPRPPTRASGKRPAG